MRDFVQQYFSDHIHGRKMNVGCAGDLMLGWVNIDITGSPDVIFDMRNVWPFHDCTFDTVYASHVLEHFTGEELFDILWEAGRVLRPGGKLLGVTPYGLSTFNLSNPFHKQAWTQHTPAQFSLLKYSDTKMDQGKRLHKWNVVSTDVILFDEWSKASEPERTFALRHYVNVARELLFVMERLDV